MLHRRPDRLRERGRREGGCAEAEQRKAEGAESHGDAAGGERKARRPPRGEGPVGT